MRFYRLDSFSYGLDEVIETRFVQEEGERFWKALKFDGFHPPLDYLVVRGVERLGPADWERKIPAILWGVAALAAFSVLLSRRAGRTVGLFALALLAAAPFHVRYSQELRPYSLGLFLMCLSLLCLDRLLARPGLGRLAALYLASLATAYTLYLAVVGLALAGGALLLEDAFAPDALRRRAARRFLKWSPAFVGALWLGYLPWWPVVVEVAHRAPVTRALPLTGQRFGRVLAFFAFAPDDGPPLGASGFFWLALAAGGLALALRSRGQRFLVAWSAGGLAAIELLSQLHPHYDTTRRFLPAGIALTAVVALPLASLFETRRSRPLALLLLAAILFLDARGLALYFREGRPDWRRLAALLRREALPGERIFSENQYTQLCLGLYLRAHDRGALSSPDDIAVLNLDGEIVRLTWSWEPGTRAWLVLAGEPHFETLRRWAEPFPALAVAAAEGAQVRRLDPALRAAAFERVPPEGRTR